MAVGAIHHVQPQNPPRIEKDKENSCLLKLAASMPLVGPFVALGARLSINPKLESFKMEDGKERMIELIDLKNQFMLHAIISSLLTLALTVAGIATGVLAPILVEAFLAFSLTCLAIGGYGYCKNRSLLEELRPMSELGFRTRVLTGKVEVW